METIERICDSVRFTREQRRTAEEAMEKLIAGWGYPVQIEGDGRNHRQIVVGDPEHAGIMVTAHYDTPSRKLMPGLEVPLNPAFHGLYQLICAVVYMIPALIVMLLVTQLIRNPRIGLAAFLICYVLTLAALRNAAANRNNRNASSGLKAVLCLLKSLPEEKRSHLCAVLFDDGEKGHRSAREFGMTHPREQHMRFSICLDRVGRGSHLLLIASDQAQKCMGFGRLKRLVEENTAMHGRVADSRRCVMSRDARLFRCGCQITVLEKKLLGLVHSALNTPGDNVCEENCISQVVLLMLNLLDAVE